NFGGEGWPGQKAWLIPADRLAARYELGAAVLGELSPWGLLEKPAQPDSRLDPVPSSVTELAALLDVASGLDLSQIAKDVKKAPEAVRSREAIRRILATAQYQVA